MLIYDGDCGFCTQSALWVSRRRPELAVAPWQSLELEPLGLTVDEVTTAAYWVDDQSCTYRGHLGLGQALQAMGGPYWPLGWLIGHRPVSWLAGPVYRLVARYRYHLPGSTDACRLDSRP